MNGLQFSYKQANDESEVVAMVAGKSKKDNGRLIFLNNVRMDHNEKEDFKFELFYDFIKHKQISQSAYNELVQCVEAGEAPTDSKLKKIYNEFIQSIKKTSEIRLPNVELEVCPLVGDNTREKKSRECVLVNGQNGSGKSYWVGNYLRKWQMLFKKSPIYLLSNKPIDDEPAFDAIKNMVQIPLTMKSLIELVGKEEFSDKKKIKKIVEELEENNYEDNEESFAPYQHFTSETGQSMVVFDDFESDGKIEAMVRTIINSILRVGRAKRIYCIIVTHTLCGGTKTKTFFSECDAFCLFSKQISPYNLKYCLKNYTRMNEHQIAKVLDSDTRWVYIHKTVPQYVIEEHKLWLY